MSPVETAGMTVRAHRTTAAPWLAVAGVVFALAATSSPLRAQPRVFVEVFDQRTGAVITDLETTEVVVRENGEVRPVLDVRPANLPTKLVLVVDNGATVTRAFDRVRDGVRAFVDRLPPYQEVSVLALAPEPSWLVQGALDPVEIQTGLDALAVAADRPFRLLDGLVVASEWLAADPEPHRPVLVVVSADGPDASAEPAARYGELMGQVRRGRIDVHGVLLSTPAPGSLRRRMSLPEAVVRDLISLSGGTFGEVYLGASLDATLAAVVERIRARTRELARQHVVLFERTSDAEPGPVQVSILRLGASFIVSSDGKSGAPTP